MKPLLFISDDADLAVEAQCHASALGLSLDVHVESEPTSRLTAALSAGEAVGVALGGTLAVSTAVELAEAARSGSGTLALACVAEPPSSSVLRELGLVAVSDVRPLLAVLAFWAVRCEKPWACSTRGLPRTVRVRLGDALSTAERGAGRLVLADGGALGWASGREAPVAIGEPRDVAEAVLAMRDAAALERPPMATVEGVERQAVLDVIFGPPRSLSDPASKAALEPYDVPLPVEELCSSPSRAAAEATRIGFPVRIALASPDLRAWDHPDLVVDHIDNAARVRDVFRQIVAIAHARSPQARVLGVTVGVATPATALLRLRVEPLPHGLVLATLGFADPHGAASRDETHTILPATGERIDAVLRRLRGCDLLFGQGGEAKNATAAISDALLRVSAFVHDWRREVAAVELNPLAILVGGGVEIREACVTVGDAFARSLDATTPPPLDDETQGRRGSEWTGRSSP